jgi:hypothetical protein
MCRVEIAFASWKRRLVGTLGIPCVTEFVQSPTRPAVWDVASCLRRQWVPAIAIRGGDRKVVTFRSHASNHKLTAWIGGINNLIHAEKAFGISSANLHIFAWVRHTTCQGHDHEHGEFASHLLVTSTGNFRPSSRVANNTVFVIQQIILLTSFIAR